MPKRLEPIRASLLMYFGSDMDCTWCYFGYMHPYLLVAIYMRNFAYLCIMVWIHMDARTHTRIYIYIYIYIYIGIIYVCFG
jgi:Na+/melibiose symporter-like transporter